VYTDEDGLRAEDRVSADVCRIRAAIGEQVTAIFGQYFEFRAHGKIAEGDAAEDLGLNDVGVYCIRE
jgi:hypothetical protein